MCVLLLETLEFGATCEWRCTLQGSKEVFLVPVQGRNGFFGVSHTVPLG